MNNKLRKYTPVPSFILSIVMISSIALLFANNAWAECSREDINYYLKKGFSHEQVAAICGQGSRANNSSQEKGYRAYEDSAEEISKERRAEERIEEEMLLIRTAIAAWDIELTPKKLEYTRKFCVAAGQTSEVEGRTRACPEVRYRIYFTDLKVKDFERKYFFIGQREIEVVGKVQRKLLSSFEGYPPDLQHQLLQRYKSTIRKGGTFVPIRKDAGIGRVLTLLRDYAGRATRNK